MYLQSYKELKVWQKSVELVEGIYILTSQFPKEEIYSLSIQMRRAVISIPSNIAEGQRRKDLPEFLHFLSIADASSAELETQIIISKRLYPHLGYLKIDGLLGEVQKMLCVMIKKLETNLKTKSSKLKAQLLIESMIAISIVIVGLLGLVGLLSRALSLNRVVSDQFTANYLAAEGVEVAKNIIDANIIQKRPWNEGIVSGEYEVSYDSPNLQSTVRQPLLFDEKTGRYNYTFGRQTSFVRVVKIEPVGSEEIKVNSIVSWTTRGGGKFEVNLEDRLFNWR